MYLYVLTKNLINLIFFIGYQFFYIEISFILFNL